MDIETIYRAADAAYDAGDYSTALQLFEQCAALGESAAMARLAIMHELGQGTPMDFDAALAWDMKAIEAGDTSAVFNIALTYVRLREIRKARRWFERALDAGWGEAAIELAKLYAVSDREADTAKAYLRRALEFDDLLEDDRAEVQSLLERELDDW
jgi:TPR repeat protein